MTIRTAHVTFLDLREHAWPPPGDRHRRDIHDLLPRVTTVEFEDDQILDPAVEASVGAEVTDDLTPVHVAPATNLGDRAPYVVSLVQR